MSGGVQLAPMTKSLFTGQETVDEPVAGPDDGAPAPVSLSLDRAGRRDPPPCPVKTRPPGDDIEKKFAAPPGFGRALVSGCGP